MLHLECATFMINQDTKRFKKMTKCIFCNRQVNYSAVLGPKDFIAGTSLLELGKKDFVKFIIRKVLVSIVCEKFDMDLINKILLQIDKFKKTETEFVTVREPIVSIINKELLKNDSTLKTNNQRIEAKMQELEEILNLRDIELNALDEDYEKKNERKQQVETILSSFESKVVGGSLRLDFWAYSGAASELLRIINHVPSHLANDKNSVRIEKIFQNLADILVCKEAVDSKVPLIPLFRAMWQQVLVSKNGNLVKSKNKKELYKNICLVKYGEIKKELFDIDDMEIKRIGTSNLNRVFVELLIGIFSFNYTFGNDPSIMPIVKNLRLINNANHSLEKKQKNSSQKIMETEEPDSKTSESLYQDFQNNSTCNIFIDWNALLEILFLVDERNQERGCQFQNFRYTVNNFWLPIFGEFIKRDLEFTDSLANMEEIPRDKFCEISSSDLNKYQAEEREWVFADFTENRQVAAAKQLQSFRVQDYLQKTEACLQDFYKNNIFNKCTNYFEKCKRKQFFKCAFCKFYFCADCQGDSMGT